jgi:hypothetical protein
MIINKHKILKPGETTIRKGVMKRNREDELIVLIHIYI